MPCPSNYNVNTSVENKLILERLSIMFTSNCKREFVPRDQVSPITCRLHFIISTHKLVVRAIFIRFSCFYLLIFYFEIFST